MMERVEKDLSEIKEKLSQIHTELTRHINTAHLHPDSLLQMLQHNLLSNLTNYLSSEAEQQLSKHMIQNCDMYEECKNRFKNLLTEQAALLSKKNVTKQDIMEKYQILEAFEKTAPYPQCSTCFSEARALLERQTQLIKTTSYQQNEEELTPIEALPTEEIVKQILDPITNLQRIEILKALYYQPRSFKQLSEITGLKGGNLLFHLQKLANTQLITQKNQRSNYQLTRKGHALLKTIQQMHTTLQKT
jgi:DNA-binding HxlR family transcriptional regulator